MNEKINQHLSQARELIRSGQWEQAAQMIGLSIDREEVQQHTDFSWFERCFGGQIDYSVGSIEKMIARTNDEVADLNNADNVAFLEESRYSRFGLKINSEEIKIQINNNSPIYKMPLELAKNLFGQPTFFKRRQEEPRRARRPAFPGQRPA